MSEVCAPSTSRLGWGSERLTAVFAAHAQQRQESDRARESDWLTQLAQQAPSSTSESAPAPPKKETRPTTLPIFPALDLAAREAGLASACRLWHLMRGIDRLGRGWLKIATIRSMLATKGSLWRIAGWRRLQTILRQGEGIFWQRTERERLFLRCVAKTAVSLNLHQLPGKRVNLPLQAFLDGMGNYNAHVYAAWHSGQAKANPISRETLQRVTAVPQRTQRLYEKRLQIRSVTNFAIGPRYSAENAKQMAWRHGGSFILNDKAGQHGAPHTRYVAWQLPNSYEKRFTAVCVKREKRALKRQLDLQQKGVRGTVTIEPIFLPHGAAAGKRYQQTNGEQDCYWRHRQGSVIHTYSTLCQLGDQSYQH